MRTQLPRRTLIDDPLARLRIAGARPSRRKLSPEELLDKIRESEDSYLDGGGPEYEDDVMDLDDPSEDDVDGPSDDPSEDDDEDDDEDEDEDGDDSRPRGRVNKSQARLHQLALAYASAKRVPYHIAYARVLRSPRGKRLYQNYIFTRGV